MQILRKAHRAQNETQIIFYYLEFLVYIFPLKTGDGGVAPIGQSEGLQNLRLQVRILPPLQGTILRIASPGKVQKAKNLT